MIQKSQQQNSSLHAESSIDFKPVALVTQAYQPWLKSIIFNFIKYVRVKWSIWLRLLWRLKGIGNKFMPQTSFVGYYKYPQYVM